MYDTLTQKYNLITQHIIRENTKKEGIEIYFSSMPSGLERDTLKENNWKWSSFNKCWYIKKNEIELETKKLVEKKQAIEKTKKVEKTKNVVNEKQVLATIKKILDYGEKHDRPQLSAFTPYEDKVVFTDSYRLGVLNRENIPFKVAFNEDNKDIQKEYVKKYKNELVHNTYPNIKSILNNFLGKESEETFTFNVEEVKKNANENKGRKNKEKREIEFTTNEGNKITVDSEYLIDMVKLLQIKEDNVKMNYYGEIKPATYQNENGFYLALPIKKY